MTATTGPSAGYAQPASDVKWYTLAPDEVASRLQVDPATGLTAAEAAQRLQKHGPNALAEAEPEPVWRRFLKQYKEYMQIVLVGAAVVSLLIGEYVTFGGLILLTLFNAWLGYRQEGKAEAAAAALGKMMKAVAKVRRDGDVNEVPADQIVPGDIVLVDAGDRVPADGRVIVAATLQIEEGALTGESVAVEKSVDAITAPEVPLGDRSDMAFMNTNVTRGHGEILVTTTGMGSEVGHIATVLAGQKVEKSPLTKQVDRLTIFIIIMAAIGFVSILVTGLAQGQDFEELFNIGVSLAVGSIPDALPAVVTLILSVGTVNMARKHAIMKSLPAVETLGSTSSPPRPITTRSAVRAMASRARCSARRAMPRSTWTTSCSRARCAMTPTSRTAPSSATRPRARSTSWRRRAASTSRRSAPAIRASRRSRSTPTTSSWRRSTRCRAPTASRSFGRT
jgi:Ca2+-transporting ATPase